MRVVEDEFLDLPEDFRYDPREQLRYADTETRQFEEYIQEWLKKNKMAFSRESDTDRNGFYSMKRMDNHSAELARYISERFNGIL